MQAARVHSLRGVDELILLDIGATPEERGPDLSLVEELSEKCFMPLTVGGGIKSVDDVAKLLRAGADKVALNTSALRNPESVHAIASRFGTQAVVASIDYKDDAVYTHCGKEKLTVKLNDGYEKSVPPLYAAGVMQHHGAGELLLTDIDREGMMQGYDLDTLWKVTDAVDIPVIVNGGCGRPDDMLEAIARGASACAAGAMFQFTDTTPRDCAEFLQKRGVEVRLE
jgi:cyclase